MFTDSVVTDSQITDSVVTEVVPISVFDPVYTVKPLLKELY